MKSDDRVINYQEVKEYFDPFDKAERPSFIKWHDFAIVNNIGFNQFLYEYLVAGHSMRPDAEALGRANETIVEIENLIKKYWKYTDAGK